MKAPRGKYASKLTGMDVWIAMESSYLSCVPAVAGTAQDCEGTPTHFELFWHPSGRPPHGDSRYATAPIAANGLPGATSFGLRQRNCENFPYSFKAGLAADCTRGVGGRFQAAMARSSAAPDRSALAMRATPSPLLISGVIRRTVRTPLLCCRLQELIFRHQHRIRVCTDNRQNPLVDRCGRVRDTLILDISRAVRSGT